MSEATERAAVLAEARRWIGTPFHHMGRIMGPQGGVDCAQFVWSVFYACGLTPFLELEHYPRDFFLHRDSERYMSVVLDRAREVTEPRPGDLALFKIGRLYAHGAIIDAPGWPNIIHAWFAQGRGVVATRADGGQLSDRPHKFFSCW